MDEVLAPHLTIESMVRLLVSHREKDSSSAVADVRTHHILELLAVEMEGRSDVANDHEEEAQAGEDRRLQAAREEYAAAMEEATRLQAVRDKENEDRRAKKQAMAAAGMAANASEDGAAARSTASTIRMVTSQEMPKRETKKTSTAKGHASGLKAMKQQVATAMAERLENAEFEFYRQTLEAQMSAHSKHALVSIQERRVARQQREALEQEVHAWAERRRTLGQIETMDFIKYEE